MEESLTWASIVEKNPKKFKIDDFELSDRRNFIERTRVSIKVREYDTRDHSIKVREYDTRDHSIKVREYDTHDHSIKVREYDTSDQSMDLKSHV